MAIDPYQARLGRAYYLEMVKIIDQQMARIMQTLDGLDLTRDTLIIFTSDHGELLGDHGLWAKGPFHYEQAVNIPLILHWPAGIPANPATNALVSHVDLVPTILAALGLPAAADTDGLNLLPHLHGQTPTVHDQIFIEHIDDPAKLRLTPIITPTHKLARYATQTFGELYNLAADPQEKTNLWTIPADAGTKAELLGKLLDFLEPEENRGARPYYV